MIDAQPLWEYPSITCSQAFTLLTFDLTESITPLSCNETVTTVGNPNGVSLWMEWIHETADGQDSLISTGPSTPSSKVIPGLSLQWDRNWKQGVYFFQHNTEEPTTNEVRWGASFSPRDGTIKFSFTKV